MSSSTTLQTSSPADSSAEAAPPAPKPKAGQYQLLNAARGFACLWVVSHHTLGFMAVKDEGIARDPLLAPFLNGALGVWVFFVISGYCIAATAVSTFTTRRPGWVHARFRRIYPAFWFSAGLCVLSYLFALATVKFHLVRTSVLAESDLLHQSWSFWLSNLTLTQELFHQEGLSGVYWTLSYEVGFYALVGLALVCCRRAGEVRTLLNTLHAITLAALAGLLVAPGHRFYPFDLWPHFGLGVLLYDALAHGWRRATLASAGLAVAGLAVFCWLYPVRHHLVDRGGYVSFLTSLLTAVLLYVLFPLDRPLAATRLGRALSWVGLFSYSLYLTHVTLIGYIFKACELGHLLPRFLPGYLLLTLVLCLGFARLFFHFCEQPYMTPRLKRMVAAAGGEKAPEREASSAP